MSGTKQHRKAIIAENTASARETQQHRMDALPIMEHYYTVQGEGAFSGTPAYFVRLAGCDVGCVWCDVKESWEVGEDQWIPLEEIVGWVTEAGAKTVVLTGGEPAMYDLWPITEAFQAAGIRVHIETSGAYPIRGDFDWVTLSPKKFKPTLAESFARAHELKVIVYNLHDLKWAEVQADGLDPAQTLLYLQPEWGKMEEVLPAIINYVKEYPKWRISLQTHKFIDIP